MSATYIAFFNNKGGVGKTTLVYHLAWMFSGLGVRVIAVDLDPQANLTAAFLDEDRLEEIWSEETPQSSIFRSVQPILKGTGDISPPGLEEIEDSLTLLVGDLELSRFDGVLADQWPRCLDRDERAFRVTSAFWRLIELAVPEQGANLVLMDLGPNLGAINRAALIGADYVLVPLSPDLFSLRGLTNLGPTLRDWRKEWRDRFDRNPNPEELKLPSGRFEVAGYIVLQHAVRLDRPVRAYERWIARIPVIYRQDVLGEPADTSVTVAADPHCLALLKHYRSLIPLAQEAKKPIFNLKPADGAIGAHFSAAKDAGDELEKLSRRIADRTGVEIP